MLLVKEDLSKWIVGPRLRLLNLCLWELDLGVVSGPLDLYIPERH